MAFRDKGFGDRLSTAENARKAMLERVRAKPGADDPAVAERRAARQAISTAREARLAEREAAKIAEQARKAADKEARQVAEHEQRVAQEANEAPPKWRPLSARSLWRPSKRQPAMPAMPPERRASELIQASAEPLLACHCTHHHTGLVMNEFQENKADTTERTVVGTPH